MATEVWCLLPLWSDFSFLYRRTNLLNWMPKVRHCEYFEAITKNRNLVEKVLSCCWTRWGRDLNVMKYTCPEYHHWFQRDNLQHQMVRTSSCLGFFCISIDSGAPESKHPVEVVFSLCDEIVFPISAVSSQAWIPQPGWLMLPNVLTILRSFSRTVRNQSREFQALQSIH